MVAQKRESATIRDEIQEPDPNNCLGLAIIGYVCFTNKWEGQIANYLRPS
jgi:hypothetical protein